MTYLSIIQRIVVVFVLFVPSMLFAQSLGFEENKGQWDEDILARFRLGNGVAWFMQDRVRIPLVDGEELLAAMDEVHDIPEITGFLAGHCYEVRFGNQSNTAITYNGPHTDYVNYFIGRDERKWATRVGIYDGVSYQEVKPGMAVHWTMANHNLKYTIELQPGIDPGNAVLEYGAVRGLSLESGRLMIELPDREVYEEAPYAYQIIEGEEIPVDCAFELNGNSVSFALGAYDASMPLFIDPTLIASTNVGSTSSTFGHSATFDQFGNIYGGGRPFGTGYPTDTGSFQMTYGGGGTDIGLSKLNEDGSALLWSTYIGGSSDEYVHSIVVNAFNDVVVYGKTRSADYPVSASAVDTTFDLNGTGTNYDICITVISDSGDQLIGSTYLGGEGQDGNNLIGGFGYSSFKGEVGSDVYSNVYIASTTTSDSINITPGAYQTELAGAQDAYIAKLNYNLSELIFATYLGGTENDGVFNVEAADDGRVYVVGITSSEDLPVTTGAEDTTYNGGVSDAFIARFSEDGSQLLQSTYVRADSNDAERGLFLELDGNGQVYIMGNTNQESIVADTNRYAGPADNRSFIRKYTRMLDSIYFTATFTNINHTAFLVDNCGNLYAAGNGPGSAQNVELTANAIMSTPAGFYIMLLNAEADSLVHGTYYGASGSHVDGGINRFDKRGAVYQATCTGGTFPLTNNAWSGNQNGGTWDLTLFKIDFDIDAAYASIQIQGNGDERGCVPHTVNFSNVGTEGWMHHWDFGDGDTSNIAQPTHTFTEPGVYEVVYVVSDTAGCILSDTANLVVTVFDTAGIDILFDSVFCTETLDLYTDSPLSNYQWSTGAATSTITIDTSGIYWVEVENACGVYNDTVDIELIEPYTFSFPPDTGICDPNFMLSGPEDALFYEWNTGATTQDIVIDSSGIYILEASTAFCSAIDTIELQVSYSNFTGGDFSTCEDSLTLSVNSGGFPVLWSTNSSADTIQVTQSGTYWVSIANDYCISADTINVIIDPLNVELGPNTVVCAPTTLSVSDPEIETYQWSTGDTTSSIEIDSSGVYWLVGNNGNCINSDTVRIDVQLLRFIDQQELICDEDSFVLAGPGPDTANYFWSTGDTTERITVRSSGIYRVTVSTDYCSNVDTMNLTFVQTPDVDVSQRLVYCKGQEAELDVALPYPGIRWSNGDTGSVLNISDSGEYYLSFSYEGCEVQDTVLIDFVRMTPDSIFEIGNVITPNGDGLNDLLSLELKRKDLVDEYNLVVFNRWGNQVFQSEFINHYWDGRMPSGEPAEVGTYYYQIKASTVCDDVPIIKIQDHVTLLR
jgi:gliding motility-associated-like protein